MNRIKITTAMLGLLTACFAPSLQADDFNKETRITTNQPLQVQNTVLPPGQYLFKLLAPDTEENVVTIFSADGRRLEGIVVGLAAYRADASDNKLLTVSQPVGDQPAVLNYWFFPPAVSQPLTNAHRMPVKIGSLKRAGKLFNVVQPG